MDLSPQVARSRITVADVREWLGGLMSQEEAAAMLGVKVKTLYNSPRYKHLRRVRVGQKKLLHPAEVLALLNDQGRGGL